MTDKEKDDFIELMAKLHKEDSCFVPYQKCPLCDGTGQSLTDGFTSIYDTCSVCKGIKIIPMFKI